MSRHPPLGGWGGVAIAFATVVIAAPRASAQTGPCPTPALARLEAPGTAPDTVPALGTYDPLRGGATDLGVGLLHPAAGEALWLWEQRLTLPLFAEPGGEPGAWLVRGWVVEPGGRPRPLGWSGLLETGYETVSIVVLERRPADWIRVRYLPGEAGTAWTHPCLFGLSEVPLAVRTWDAWLTSPDLSPLYFVDGLEHTLRSGAEPGAEPVAGIPEGSDYDITPVEVQGDWMRVRVTIPSDYCVFADTPPEPVEGWIRWRAPGGAPQLWYYTRGC